MNSAPSSMLQYIVERVTVNVELHEALNISSLQGWFRSIICAKRTPRALYSRPSYGWMMGVSIHFDGLAPSRKNAWNKVNYTSDSTQHSRPGLALRLEEGIAGDKRDKHRFGVGKETLGENTG